MNELSYAGPSIGGLIGLQGGQTTETTEHKQPLRRVFRHPVAWLVLTLSLALLPAASHADGGQNLLTAASNGDLQQVRALLNKGAKIDKQSKDGLTALLLASRNGHSAVVQALLDKDAKIERSPDGHALAMQAKEEGLRVIKASGAMKAWAGPVAAQHICGGTIMGESAKDSVCNGYGQVHEVPNLIIGGQSTFPTCSSGNTTFIIQALAERTSDYLLAES